MAYKDYRIKEEKAQEILELAARYYTEQTNQAVAPGFSISELIDAGLEAEIPDEFIKQAIADIEAKNNVKQAKKSEKRKFKYSVTLISAIALLAGLTFIFKDSLYVAMAQLGIGFANSEVSNLDPQTKIKLAAMGDTFSGYSTLRNTKFHNSLAKQNIQLTYSNEFAQDARANAIDSGKADFIVTTLDQYLIHQPQGKIVGLVDRTIGADAVVFNNQAYPQLKSLIDLETLIAEQASEGKWLKIVFAEDTPSEFLATVLDTKFDNFQLDNLEVLKVADSSIAWSEMQQDEDIALGILWEPFVTKAQSKGNSIALSSGDAPKTIVDIIVASDRILANNPDAVTEFISTYYQSIDSSVANSSLLTHQIAIDGKMKPHEAKTVTNGIKFFTSLEAAQWMQSGALEQRIEAIASILTLAGKIDYIPPDSSSLFTAEHLTPAVNRTNRLIKEISQDNPELANKLQGVSTVKSKSPSDDKIAQAKPIGNLSVEGEVKFQTGSAQLTPASKAILDQLSSEIAEFNPDNIAIKVQGHTSKTGSVVVNQNLSQQRAETVVKLLQQKNSAHKFISEGLGFQQPLPGVAPTSPLNQRTVIRLVRIGS
ncbi:MAG: OmpA family protein [Cyanobacteria bacterium P01_G01_bin.39]